MVVIVEIPDDEGSNGGESLSPEDMEINQQEEAAPISDIQEDCDSRGEANPKPEDKGSNGGESLNPKDMEINQQEEAAPISDIQEDCDSRGEANPKLEEPQKKTIDLPRDFMEIIVARSVRKEKRLSWDLFSQVARGYLTSPFAQLCRDIQEDQPRLSLPYDLMEVIGASLPMYKRGCMMLLNKDLARFFNSPRFTEVRLQHRFREQILYVLIGFQKSQERKWFVFLDREIKITSFPSTAPGAAVVSVGHLLYVMGGEGCVKEAYRIDCRALKVQKLPSMRKGRVGAAAGFIEGRLYVFGGVQNGGNDVVEYYDIERDTWETVAPPANLHNLQIGFSTAYGYSSLIQTYVVFDKKLYVQDSFQTFAFDPIAESLETDLPLMEIWQQSQSSCVLNGDLFCLNTSSQASIFIYDVVGKLWKPVVVALPDLVDYDCHLAALDGNLMALGKNRRNASDIFCFKVYIIRDHGRLSGKVGEICCALRAADKETPSIDLCRTVTI